ncbi:MAG: deoxyribodipyrimidine photo-lyase [Ignavibacteria bacterium]
MFYIFWFRKDLRLIDNRALSEFTKTVSDKNKFTFLYIKNKNTYNYFGQKRISFLLECLDELTSELISFGFTLQVVEGKSFSVFERLIDRYNSINVFTNKQVEPYCIERDKAVSSLIESQGGEFNSFSDTTIFETGEIKNGLGEQYKVFTPFKNRALEVLSKDNYKKINSNLSELKSGNEVLPKDFGEFNIKSEYKKLEHSEFIKGGRIEGLKLLKSFYENDLELYQSKRNFPYLKGTSLLSPHLHFGTIGIREAFRTAISKSGKVSGSKKISTQTWINELLWREFYYNITFHNPQITYQSFRKEFDDLKWNYDESIFSKWCEGMTGFPIVDAGMRQLNKEGWMHNRVRMITAMFFTKDLLMDWRFGENYFAQKLIDLDFSNNNGGWQWSSSTGVDAQPYFRIFNPYLQSKKFDAKGDYIKKYVPELRSLPEKFIHQPDLMSEMEQEMYNVRIGKDYPGPIVDHSKVRNEVIEKFKKLSEKF